MAVRAGVQVGRLFHLSEERAMENVIVWAIVGAAGVWGGLRLLRKRKGRRVRFGLRRL